MKSPKLRRLSFLFLVFWVLGYSSGWSMGEKGAEVKNLPAAEFSLPDLAGKQIKLSDFRGKVVFLNFFATWCPPCRAEMPSIQKLYNMMKKEKFEVLAVSIDKTSPKDFIEKGGYTFKVLIDPGGKVASQYGVVNIPATFILDKKGKIVDRIIGSADWADEKTVQNLLKIIRHEK